MITDIAMLGFRRSFFGRCLAVAEFLDDIVKEKL